MTDPSSSPRVALVLSGGGARGAYEAGVLAGLAEVGHRDGTAVRPHFDIVTGTSVGAINAAQVAAGADRNDRGISELIRIWTSLRLETHLRPQPGRFLAWRRLIKAAQRSPHGPRWGRALLDARPFESIVEHGIAWDRLHENVRRGVVKAVIVSALNVATGRTTTFVELGAEGVYVPSRDPSHTSRIAKLTADHVLASAAIPLLFPARRVGSSYFCDGGLRFNTPIAPAIRAGADRLLVVALRAGRPSSDEEEALEQYPNPVYLLGKIFDALLLDPIEHDLQVLERLNRVLEGLEGRVPAGALDHLGSVVEADRGLPYRRIRTLVFRPSEDIGVLALEHLRTHRAGLCRRGGAATMLLENAAALGEHVEADLLSFLLFDGAFARTLIELGRRDVRERAVEVRAFFAPSEELARHLPCSDDVHASRPT